MQKIYLNGSLSLDESDMDRMNYIIKDVETGKQTSITDILDTIYNSSNTINKLVRVLGRIYNNNHTFGGFNSLHIAKDRDGVYSYHIGSFPIWKQLFELAANNSNVEILLEDYTNSITQFITDTEDTDHGKTTKTA
jgi:hypothetical protein